MSLRHPLRALPSWIPSTRCIATSSRFLAPSAQIPPSSRPADPNSSGNFGELFSDLQDVKSTDTSASLWSTSSSPPSTHTPERAALVRGYQPESIPPKVDPLLDLFTNMLMKHGRKAEAQSHVSEILSMLQKASNLPPQPLLARAVALASPAIRMNSTRKRAKIVQTPKALDERQRSRQGIVWLLKASERGRKAGFPRNQRIAREVFAVLEGTSDVFKWVEERHRLATQNRSNLNTR